MPDPASNLADALSLHARQRPTQPAIVHGDAIVCYRELESEVLRRAACLQDRGVRPGDIVGVALRDSTEHLLMLHAVARAGAVILPMDWRWKAFEMKRLIDHFTPSALMVEPGVTIDGAPCIEVSEGWLRQVAAADGGRAFPDGDRGLVMSLSSGTTGRPKGPMLSHQTFRNRFWTHWIDLGFGSRETYLNATPLYFGGGRAFSLSTLHVGATVVLFPPPYEPAALAAEVSRTGATVLFLVPTLLRRLLACDDATLAPFRRLKTLISSGSALTASERTSIRERICADFIEYYSSTEGGGITALTPADQRLHGGSVGRPVFGVEVQVVDVDHRPLPPDGVGRIRYRGSAVADGFYRDPEASREAFLDDWFYPGDLGSFDAEGYLYLKGRAKDMIIRGGINIYPLEIEATLMSHDAVSDAAVIGWPSKEFDEEVAAFVTLRQPVAVDVLTALCRERLASYKVPKRIFVVPELPRNAGGKVVKTALLEQLPAQM